MSRRVRSKNKKVDRSPVDSSRLNMGNTYSSAPEFYYDIEFDCQDCGLHITWTAKQQKCGMKRREAIFSPAQFGVETVE